MNPCESGRVGKCPFPLCAHDPHIYLLKPTVCASFICPLTRTPVNLTDRSALRGKRAFISFKFCLKRQSYPCLLQLHVGGLGPDVQKEQCFEYLWYIWGVSLIIWAALMSLFLYYTQSFFPFWACNHVLVKWICWIGNRLFKWLSGSDLPVEVIGHVDLWWVCTSLSSNVGLASKCLKMGSLWEHGDL